MSNFNFLIGDMCKRFRFVQNYEYSAGDFLSTKTIFGDARRDHVAIHESLLGRVLHNIWGKKVEKVSPFSENGAGYANVRKRNVEDSYSNEVQDFNDEMLKRINLICGNHEGWVVNAAENRVSLLKLPSPPEITIEGRRLVCEVIITLDPASIAMRTHGKEVLLKDVFGADVGVPVSLYTIDTIVRLVEATSLCLGHLEIADENIGNFLQVPVSNSSVLEISMNDCSKKMLVSTLIAVGTKACKSCVYSATLWKNRERKRKIVNRSSLHSKCNLRYLARDGLKKRINNQQKEMKADGKREKRMKEEMIEFLEDDSVDLKRILDEIKSDDIPPDMKLLWDVQIKQLSVKSPKGYRWHPRFFRFIFLFFNFTNSL